MRNSLIALSGGVDSTTLLYESREEVACAVGFDYGSKHNARELAAAEAICRELGIPYLIIPLAFIGEYFRSDLLLSGGEMQLGDYSEENMRSTVVPFRNGIMLSILAAVSYTHLYVYKRQLICSIDLFACSVCNRTHKLLTNFSKNWFYLLPGPLRAWKI